MEAVSGRDLNWFFDQWFFGVGHPEVTIDYRYDPSGVAVTIAQQQGRAFAVPIVIDVYDAAGKKRYPVWLRQQRDSFYFPCQGAPLLANVDAEKTVVWAKTDHQPLRAFVYQYDHAGNFVDRREAVTACLQQPGDAAAMAVIQKALRDPYAGIRQFVLLGLARTPVSTKRAVEATVAGLARRDPNALVRRYALRLLPEYGSTYESLIIRSLDDSSYSAAGEALNALGRIDSMAGLAAARARLREKSRGTLAEEIVGTLAQWGSEEEFDVIADRFMQLPFKPRIARKFAAYLQRVHSPARVQQGTELLARMRGRLPK
jgi:aminopeptidase N